MGSSLGQRIRELRSIKRMTQEQLAEMCNVSTSCISRWENDSLYPKRKNLTLLMKALGANEVDFLMAPQKASKDVLLQEYITLVQQMNFVEQEYFLSIIKGYLDMRTRIPKDDDIL